MSRLRVFAGPSPSSLVPISDLVNTNTPHTISSDKFEGHVVVNIKGFTNPQGRLVDDSEYFSRPDRKDITWSIQVQGRILEPCSADDILFGNTFDRPLHLPWGSNAVLKLATFKDPSLEYDINSQTKPWALSPLISTMPHFSHCRLHGTSGEHNDLSVLSPEHPQVPPFPPKHSIEDDLTQTHVINSDDNVDLSPSSRSSLSQNSKTGVKNKLKEKLDTAGIRQKNDSGHDDAPADELHGIQDLHSTQQRRKYFRDPKHRKNLIFGPNDIMTLDFCHGYLEFSPRITLRLPGGISFDAMKHWDGQPVRFVCCKRRKSSEGGASGAPSNMEDPCGHIFWCVQFELVEAEENERTDSEGECDHGEDFDK